MKQKESNKKSDIKNSFVDISLDAKGSDRLFSYALAEFVFANSDKCMKELMKDKSRAFCFSLTSEAGKMTGKLDSVDGECNAEDKMNENALTVGELKRLIKELAEDVTLTFPGGLTFSRLKRVANDEILIEFNEPQAYLSNSFRRRNPHVKVAFIDTSNVKWDKIGAVGEPVDIEVQ